MTKTQSSTSANWRTAPEARTPTPDERAALQRALDRAGPWLATRDSHPALVARRLLRRPRPDDATAAGFMVREARRRTRMDGSIDGSLVRTALTVAELLDLGAMPDDAPVVRTLGFVLSCQNAPGHFGEGCDPERHVAGLCSHALTGFFSPGPRDESVAPLLLPTGLRVENEEHARFVVSCLALRTALRAGEDRRAGVRAHVDCLLDIPGLWRPDAAPWPLDVQVAALGGVMLGPLDHRDRVNQCVDVVVARQAADGSWPGGELFHVLDVLTVLGTAAARQAVDRSVPHVIASQLEDGTWGGSGVGVDVRALIGLRALRLALHEV